MSGEELQIYRPDGQPFASYVEIAQRAEQAEQRAEQTASQLEQQRQRTEQLAERLKAMGIDPDQI